jgi:hypothetical protein
MEGLGCQFNERIAERPTKQKYVSFVQHMHDDEFRRCKNEI